MPSPLHRPLCAAALALTLAGCAAQTSTRYPSLLPRAIETRSDAVAETPDAAVQPDPALDATLADLGRQLDAAVVAFVPAAGEAERLASAARGVRVGEERWIAAQAALAGLDGCRATTSTIVTDIDALALARAGEGRPDYPALTRLHDTAQAALDTQSARIAAIGARLPDA